MTDPRRRGSQAFAHDLDAALRERGRQSSIVALAGGGELDIAVLGPTRMHHRTLRELRRRAAEADVVVAHGSTTLDACGIALTGTGTPFVYVNIGDPRHWAPDRLRRARVGAMLRRAAAVASVSPTGRDILRETYRLVPERVQAIPNGRRPERFLPPDAADRAEARAELGLPAGATVLAVVGALAPEKRVALAIEAFALLVTDTTEIADKAAADGLPPREQPDCLRLVVAGDGPERERLETLAHRRAPGLVTFTGNVADLGPVYRASDAIVLSSVSEGVPGVLVEAGLTGVPAAATDVGFVRDVVVDGVTGALDPSGEPRALAVAIRRVLADREAMGRAARARCLERHAMETVVDAWVTLLDGTSRAGSAP
ncbi:glycosyltransferase family 4 protein [Streptomyces sp. SID3343]|uniref:glycosyltransferase n=1 Tax=Streptomyces sp. SID3343 TaxID=2690260 RepID=UPI001369EA34|nr:glycosyltransferase [Streptomyces sp. SID3343]